MSIFKNFFNKDNEEPNEPEDNFNRLLRKMDFDKYQNELQNKDFIKPETAFDIIALINKLEYERLNIYTDELGERWIRTKYGFEPTISYNLKFENTELKEEIKARENEINNLNLRHNRMQKVVEHEQALNINYREKINKQNSQAFLRLIRSKEAKKIRKNITSINKTIHSNLSLLDLDSKKISDTNITQNLIRLAKTNEQLKQILKDIYSENEKTLTDLSSNNND